MIKIKNTEVYGWEAAIRGMRNPMNSWEKSDSQFEDVFTDYEDLINYYMKTADIGENDLDLMKRLAKAGTEHAKYLRYINVTVDLVAPLYWYKEMDCYRFGVEHNSCSTMHKIQEKEFTLDDFSHEHLSSMDIGGGIGAPIRMLKNTIIMLNGCRYLFLKTNDKEYWWQMIQLLPSSYNQRRTYQFSYQALANIYIQRKNHKLDEWRDFCRWIESLPYSELITGASK